MVTRAYPFVSKLRRSAYAAKSSFWCLDWLESFKPDLVLVAFGTNDCCHHFLIPEETQLALTTLATEIRKRYDADVVLVSTGGDNPLKLSIDARSIEAAKATIDFCIAHVWLRF